MNSIGNRIKDLRKKQDLTQEELAEQLNISSQAVSKWENGICLPDISQIIPLVKIFGITSDELLGISDESENEAVDALIKECKDYIKDGYFKDKMLEVHNRCNEMLDKYPNNMRLLSYTVSHIVNMITDNDEKNKLYDEAIRRANVIVKYSKDISQVMDAKQWLVLIYCNLHEYELAREYANQFPNNFYYNSGIQRALTYHCEGDRKNELKEYCNNISDLIDTLRNELATLGEAYMSADRYEDAIYTFETVLRIKDEIYQSEEYTPPMHRLSSFYTTLANCYLHIGNKETALSYLEKGFEYMCITEKYYNKVKHIDNPLLLGKDFSCSEDEFYGRFEMKDHMNDSCFDSVREDERFVAIYKRL